jgi:low affinity Fe/Cu permease
MPAVATSRRANGSHAEIGQANGKAAAKQASTTASPTSTRSVVCPPSSKSPSWFTMFAQRTAQLAGRPTTFMLATLIIVVWAVTGPLFNYSDTWQLVINTGTTIVTFLMVFLIQHTQNRDSLAFQVKLDELIIKLREAGDEIAGVEDLCDEDLEALHEKYRQRAARANDILQSQHSPR